MYAAGDACLPEKFTHAAVATAKLAVANALDGAEQRLSELVIPHCTYTDPEVARSGSLRKSRRSGGSPSTFTGWNWRELSGR